MHAVDVAEFILRTSGPMSAFKLQKLTYYADAWHLVHLDRPLVDEPFEAWANGPVVRALYERHRGEYRIKTVGGDDRQVTGDSAEVVDDVLEAYAHLDAGQLVELTHAEQPWREARRGLAPGIHSRQHIDRGLVKSYYGARLQASA